MGRFHAVQLTNDFASRDRSRFLAIRTHYEQPVEKRAIEFLSPPLPAWRATPQYPCSITHLRIDSGLRLQACLNWPYHFDRLPGFLSFNSISIVVPETAEEIFPPTEIPKEVQAA